jgi:predicted nicotinamide N-methyase
VIPITPLGRALQIRRPPLCPELRLWLLGDEVDLEADCRELGADEAPPYWAFCWGSGQALARFVLDHPDEVRDRAVVDLGTGSGVVAIAAALAGARSVVAVDCDRQALAAARANAELNGVQLRTSERVPERREVLLAADVLYDSAGRRWLLELARGSGRVWVADPERASGPRLETPPLCRMPATTLPDVDSPARTAAIFRLDAPGAPAAPARDPQL